VLDGADPDLGVQLKELTGGGVQYAFEEAGPHPGRELIAQRGEAQQIEATPSSAATTGSGPRLTVY
jgi:hypothetical protein